MSGLPVGRNTVVSVKVEMFDAQNVELDRPEEPITYLHGGYGGLLEALERAMEGHYAGETIRIQVEPEDAFGDYDAALLRVEPVDRYGEGIAPGMQIEDAFEGEGARLYTVTDVAAGKVVLDGNHPFAGMALRFALHIVSVRAASSEEIAQGVSLSRG